MKSNLNPLILAVLLGLTLCVPQTAYALTVNAQNTTTCENGYCETVLDLAKYLTPGTITTIKGVNYSSSLPKTNVNLTGINYKYNGTSLIVYGYVKKFTSVYWSMNLGSYVTIDPYWSYGNENVWTNPGTPAGPSGDASNYFGVKIFTANQCELVATLYQSNPYTITRVYASDGQTALCNNATGSGNWANFTGCFLNASSTYYIVGVPAGTRIYYDPATYPQVGTDFNVTAGVSQGLPLGAGNSLSFEFTKIVTKTGTLVNETVTSTALYLNGFSSNLTTTNQTPVNITGITNYSGLTVGIKINGTFSGNGTNNVTNLTRLGVGLWNVTAYTIGNISVNSSQTTYWLEVTAWIPDLNQTIYFIQSCYDNNWLQLNYTYTNPLTYNLTRVFCEAGCSNNACNPPEWEQALFMIFGSLMVVTLIYFVVRRRKK